MTSFMVLAATTKLTAGGDVRRGDAGGRRSREEQEEQEEQEEEQEEGEKEAADAEVYLQGPRGGGQVTAPGTSRYLHVSSGRGRPCEDMRPCV